MGRKKIQVRRIECEKERSNKYSKRKKGLLKKVEEMAVLCDVDIVILLFSPTSKPTLFHPPSRPLSTILERLSTISLQDREERRAYTIETLKKMYKNNTGVPTENIPRDEVLQEDYKVTELRETKELLDEKMAVLRVFIESIRDWQNPYEVNDLDRLNIMEKYLVSSLAKIRKIKIQEDQPTLI